MNEQWKNYNFWENRTNFDGNFNDDYEPLINFFEQYSIEKYVIVARGWFMNLCSKTFFDSFEDCLKYMGMTEEEYNQQLKNSTDTEGLWYYEIKKVNVKNYLENLLKALKNANKDKNTMIKNIRILKEENQQIKNDASKIGLELAKKSIEKKLEDLT